MIETYPNPWNFENNDGKLFSNDKSYRIVYSELREIGMGAPLAGDSYFENANQKVKIHNFCGGPGLWETNGNLLAIPIWINIFFKGTVQRIGVFDVKSNELKIYSKIFNVLDLRTFEKNMIYGYDSPIYKTKTVSFDVDKEKIKMIIKLK